MLTTLPAESMAAREATVVEPGDFERARHVYPRVLNAQIHPLVAYFLRLSPKRMVERYCHLNPQVDAEALTELLATPTKVLHWAGADLFYTVNENGVRRMVVIETNSCPSGNKSMPLLSEDNEQGGYKTLLERAFLPRIKKRSVSSGRLAVLFDKNLTEAGGYAAALADLTDEPVLLAPFPVDEPDPPARFVDRALEVRGPSGEWEPVRAAFRYVTQRPWDRIPVSTRTVMFNPVLGCLAGGRNKLIASTAYELLNARIKGTGLRLRSPETIRDVSLEEVPLWVDRFGGHAVVKNPYSNAGQGVWTITGKKDLDALSALEHRYDRFIVQGLVGNASWSSEHEGSRYFHVGTMPNKKGHIFAADLRMMVASGPDGFFPLSIYARRARAPLARELEEGSDSWAMLGTNLSEKLSDGGWGADAERLLLMDRRDFNTLGLGPDDLLEAFIQSVLSVVAIDELGQKLLSKKGGLKSKLFRSLNNDDALIDELVPTAPAPA